MPITDIVNKHFQHLTKKIIFTKNNIDKKNILFIIITMKINQGVTMELVKVTVRTANGLIVECELKPQTIKKLKTEKEVSVRKSGGKK